MQGVSLRVAVVMAVMACARAAYAVAISGQFDGAPVDGTMNVTGDAVSGIKAAFASLNLATHEVPEPATLLLLAVGVCAMAFALRRRGPHMLRRRFRRQRTSHGKHARHDEP